MARTALLYVLPAGLVVTGWSQLEEGGPAGAALWMAALALLPGLARTPLRRALAAVGVSLVAAGQAFGVSPLDARPFDGEHDYVGPFLSRFRDGVLEFYDVSLPFVRPEHPLMHGAVLMAIFGFCLAVSLAVSARRPLAAGLALLAGAAWPATLVSEGGTSRGALILAAVLMLLTAGGRRPAAGYGRAAVAGAVVVAAAVAGASSPAVAKGEFLAWKHWDAYDRPEDPVSVRFVWDANYGGIRFPNEVTTVLTVDGIRRPLYWRATTLDTFDGLRWKEDLGVIQVTQGSASLLSDSFLPARARDPSKWVRGAITVHALRDRRLAAPSMPVAWNVPPTMGQVEYLTGGVARAAREPESDASYVVFAYAPNPSPRQLAAVRPTGLRRGTVESRYLEIAPGAAALPWRAPGSEERLRNLFAGDAPAGRLAPYRALAETARRVAGSQRSPYAATAALEQWFRSNGGFRYDEQPGVARDTPPLVDFVTERKRGYCQQFAGAMTLMLRLLGIPARVAAGFTSGSYDARTGSWTVTDHDAHTWVEVWFDGWGWLPFDPTPGRGQLDGSYTFASPSINRPDVARVLGRGRQGGSSLAVQGERLKAAGRLDSGPGRGAGIGRREGASLLRLLVLLAAAAIAAIAAAKLVRRGLRLLRRDPRRVAAACRAELADYLVDQGLAVDRSATLAELARAAEAELGVDARRFAAATGAAGYARPSEAARSARAARRELTTLRRRLRETVSASRRARGLLSLRSLGLSA